MKKIICLTAVIIFASSLCFAQSAPEKSKQAQKDASAAQIYLGKVKTVSLGDTAKGTRPEITVVDTNGKEMTFTISASASITGKAGKLTMDKLAAGQNVTVKYKQTKEGTKEATGIRIAD